MARSTRGRADHLVAEVLDRAPARADAEGVAGDDLDRVPGG